MITASMPGTASEPRLIGWKAIGSYLGCDARTAKRWESVRAMPVRRMPGDGVPAVWADRAELQAWLAGSTEAPAGAVTETEIPLRPGAATPSVDAPLPFLPMSFHRRWFRSRLAALFVAGLAITASAVTMVDRNARAVAMPTAHPQAAPYDDDASARATYLNARFELATRSPQGIAAAQRDFQALTMRFPDRAAGYSGLADAYVLSREFGAVPDAVAYPRAAQAARTALALDPELADAWLNRAYVAFWWQHDVAGGLAAFRQALERAPQSAKAHHWYATAAVAIGEFALAQAEIGRARVLDPDNHAIVADAAFIELCSGNRDAAIEALEALVQIDPRFIAGHRYLALADLIAGRDADYLREAAATAQLMDRPARVAAVARAAARWQAGGRTALLAQLAIDALAITQDVAATPDGDALLEIVRLRALAGDRVGFLNALVRAKAAKLPMAFLAGDPELIRFRHDPALIAVLKSS